MAIGDVTRVNMTGQRGTSFISFTRYWETTQSIGDKQSEYDALVTALNANYFDQFGDDDVLSLTHQDLQYFTWRFRDVRNLTLGIDYNAPDNSIGELVGDPLDRRVAMYGQRKAVSIGRRFQGFNYLPFGDESKNSDGNWDNTFKNNVRDWYESGRTLQPLPLLHQFREVNYSVKFDIVTVIGSYVVKARQAYLKKRQN